MDLSVLGFEVLSRGFHQCEQLTAHKLERSADVCGKPLPVPRFDVLLSILATNLHCLFPGKTAVDPGGNDVIERSQSH